MRLILFILLTLAISTNTRAEVVVVVNKNSAISNLTQGEVIDIFMGRFNTFPDGSAARPIDSPEKTETKNDFYMQLVQQNERKIKSYWARLLFSGRASPPEKTSSIEEVLAKLQEKQGTIAYIPESAIDDSVKVVFRFD